jgi:hypothetical protein
MPDPLPAFAVDNDPSSQLDRDCVRVDVQGGLTAGWTMQTHFVGEHTFDIGQAILVSLGASTEQRTIFVGAISAIQLVFDESVPPMVVVSARAPASPPSVTSYTFVRGQELLAARVMVKKAREFVTVTGIASGWPDIYLGTILRLQHIGASFSGDGYHVTRIGHTFDLEQGLRSTFTAERPI